MSNATPSGSEWSRCFKEVLREELQHVGGKIEKPCADVNALAHQKQLVGLAFSGGGIRSATFNLGVLQALAQMRLLSRFDYLSTVSGGGYIGSWLMAWIQRRGLKDVEEALRPEWVKQPGHTEPAEIRFLRQFSNYLTPKLGWLGADMWTVIATYLRNLILNLTVLIATMTVLLLLPRILAMGSIAAWRWFDPKVWASTAIVAVFLAMFMIARSLRCFRRRASDQREPEMPREDFEDREAICLFTGGPATEWKTAAGAPVTPPVVDAALNSWVWFDRDFDDFVLKTKFSSQADARALISVWGNRPSADNVRCILGRGHVVHVCGAEVKAPSAGAIDEEEPVRPAALRGEWNNLEIICVKDVITVRINEETINTLRVAREEQRPPRRFGWNKWKAGVIALRRSPGVKFDNLRVRALASSLETGGTQGQIQWFIVAPLFFAAFLATFLFCFGDVSASALPGVRAMRTMIHENALPIEPWPWLTCAFVTGGLAAALVLLARVIATGWEKAKAAVQGTELRLKWRTLIKSILAETVSLGAASLLGGCGVRALYEIFKGRTLWEVATWGTPALIGLSMLVLTLHIGLLGRELPDQVREWWSRLGAWLLIYSLLWIAIFATAFYVSVFFYFVSTLAISISWLASTIWGVFAARSVSTGDRKSSKVASLVAQIAPYVFVVGLFLFLSWGIDRLVPLIASVGMALSDSEAENISIFLARHWRMMDVSNTWLALGALAGTAILLSAVFSWRLDINQFSMHLLYRNRLGRCYLGASNRFRRAQPFTGFAAADDFNLWELEDLLDKREKRPSPSPSPPNPPGSEERHMTAPYLIINAALNLVGGKELAWQQRKAASFVFTQKYCGYEFPELPPGYSPTIEYAASPSPVSLATAMAISGAAASPNMGYHTSPASAFLMTVFNVRLGWWLGNTRAAKTWNKSSPGNVLMSLLRELFGLTSDEGKFIYLSDGGHFENLGIYELVRRRCRFIVACDAEEDQSFGFGGLGNAIEKSRADLGIPIDIDVEPIRRRNEQGHTNWHCAIGKIRYSAADEGQPDGILVYLKSSLTGDEPTDVLRYAADNPEFPHQSTGDQWFDESQFESYRALGCHIMREVFGAVDAPEKLWLLTKEELFVGLAQRWYPPSAVTKVSFTKLSARLGAIYDELRENKNLAFLSEQIYPEWRVLFAPTQGWLTRWRESSRGASKSLRERLPRTPDELQAGFYVCNSILDLMENVYLDLDLENEFDHPDNRGWMNFFRHWSWAPMCRVAWTISASNYGARFQSFCERHLDLKIGVTEVENLKIEPASSGPPWPVEAGRLSRALAATIWRWLAKKLPLDAEARSRAVAKAATYPAVDPQHSEKEALVMAHDAIMKALDKKEQAGVIPRPNSNAIKDAEWIAAATLLEMIRRGVAEAHRAHYENEIAEFVRFHAATIAKRFSTDAMRERLNATERELIELFFIYNPKLAETGRIVRFYLIPGSEPALCLEENRNAEDDLKFPFGFAILATIGKQEKLVYLRVQDHLRSMGLARHALEKMIQKARDSGTTMMAEYYAMHPDAHEVPTDEGRRRFLTLFDSAKMAQQQKGILESRLRS